MKKKLLEQKSNLQRFVIKECDACFGTGEIEELEEIIIANNKVSIKRIYVCSACKGDGQYEVDLYKKARSVFLAWILVLTGVFTFFALGIIVSGYNFGCLTIILCFLLLMVFNKEMGNILSMPAAFTAMKLLRQTDEHDGWFENELVDSVNDDLLIHEATQPQNKKDQS